MLPLKTLRVNADDYGFTKGVTDGILQAHRSGIVTHTSIMAGGLDFRRAAALAAENLTLGVGVHLTLTWGMPVLSPENVSSLVDQDGRFYPIGKVTFNSVIGKINANELYQEWSAQIEKVIDKGIRPKHLDTHHHMHLLPNCFSTVMKLSDYYKIDYVRKPEELINIGDKSLLKKLIFRLLCMRKWNQKSSDQFYGLSLQNENAYLEDLKKFLQNMPNGLTELMVHPGKVDQDLLNTDSMCHKREEELVALCDPELPEILRRNNIQLAKPDV
jgi:chitin disaccharide deacetylase